MVVIVLLVAVRIEAADSDVEEARADVRPNDRRNVAKIARQVRILETVVVVERRIVGEVVVLVVVSVAVHHQGFHLADGIPRQVVLLERIDRRHAGVADVDDLGEQHARCSAFLVHGPERLRTVGRVVPGREAQLVQPVERKQARAGRREV